MHTLSPIDRFLVFIIAFLLRFFPRPRKARRDIAIIGSQCRDPYDDHHAVTNFGT
jgi:hypothetical protein